LPVLEWGGEGAVSLGKTREGDYRSKGGIERREEGKGEKKKKRKKNKNSGVETHFEKRNKEQKRAIR